MPVGECLELEVRKPVAIRHLRVVNEKREDMRPCGECRCDLFPNPVLGILQPGVILEGAFVELGRLPARTDDDDHDAALASVPLELFGPELCTLQPSLVAIDAIAAEAIRQVVVQTSDDRIRVS